MLDLADLDHTLIYFVSFLAAFLSIRPTLRAVGTCGALLLAWTFVKLELTFDLADLLLNEGTNPQFITAGVAALGIFGLAIRVSRTRWRTMDRTLILVAMISVCLTTAVFHLVLVNRVLPLWAKDIAWTNYNLVEASTETFAPKCEQAKVICWRGTAFEDGAFKPELREQLRGWIPFSGLTPSHSLKDMVSVCSTTSRMMASLLCSTTWTRERHES
ncbi:hypothetical protein P4126_32105 [Pseudomonas aeruginosa]|nr:hypothetical protein [Pseudomonas aeruginosa]MDF5940715.1 hypothetical protein [Pseudomonas aeruginosa]MDF5950375.1 hypothetical protein [Pseudomonas aeruginosa]